ncbi:hypothetical protein [Phytohabitans houttuyneae]|uniref:Uncharacterized protein n=1 Tax=Phytohabitans houttuyneae TaxID=1076126 RepID=A0A6V8KB98_9ACTN|nr:hypothetical protein [Phytohabitans houttuyneae]GFJ79439.1 hypothetical protein Phou_036190 [Phytohabitans houttuyneae]
MPPKKGDRVAPPPPPGGWELRHASKGAVDGWEELNRQAPNALFKAWHVISTQPETPDNFERQHPLKGELGTRMVQGKNLEQWQYEVTGGGRIWYCPDSERRIVWVTLARTGHPKATD